MAWQFALGLLIGGVLIAGVTILLARVVPAGTFIGLLGLAAAVAFMGGLVGQVRTIVSLLTIDNGDGGFSFRGGHAPAWWCLAGIVIGAAVTIGVIRGDEGEPTGARASTPRFLALVGLVLAIAAHAPHRFGGFGVDTGDALVYWAGLGVAVGLAAIAFGTRPNQPESPSYVTFTTATGAALVGLLVGVIDSQSRLDPLLVGVAVIPLLVGGVVALSGLLRPLAEGSGRSVTILTSAGLGVLLVDSLVVSAVVGGSSLLASVFFFGAGDDFSFGFWSPG